MRKRIPSWGRKNPEKWEQIEFNKNYLKKLEKTHGSLHCEYCGKENLVIYEWYDKCDHNIVATVDHFYPSSKYKELKKNEDNFVVSCNSCNSGKKDDLWETDRLVYPINENKINILINLEYVGDKRID